MITSASVMKQSAITVVATRGSQQITLPGLLNCLIRQFALPSGVAEYTWPEDIIGFMEGQERKTDHVPRHIRLSGERQFLVVAGRGNAPGSQGYLSDVMVRSDGVHWFTPPFTELAVWAYLWSLS